MEIEFPLTPSVERQSRSLSRDAISFAVRLPESFRGGCSFGAEILKSN